MQFTRLKCLIVQLVVVLSFGLFSFGSDAAQPDFLDALKPALEKAGESGATVIIVNAENGETIPDSKSRYTLFRENLLLARSEARRIALKAPQLPGNMLNTLRQASPEGDMKWLIYAIGTAILGIVLGFWAKKPIQNSARDYFKFLYKENPQGRSEQFPYLAYRAAILGIISAVLFVVAIFIGLVLDSGHEASRNTILAIVSAYTIFRLLRWTLHFNFFVPNTSDANLSNYRMLNLSDDDANAMFFHWSFIDGLAVGMFAVCIWMNSLGLDGDAHKLALIASVIILVILLIIVFIREKMPFTGVILGTGDPADKPWWLRLISRMWLGLSILYLVIAGMTSIVRILLDKPAAVDVVLAPIAVFLASLTFYAAMVVALDKYLAKRLHAQQADHEIEVLRINRENEELRDQIRQETEDNNDYTAPSVPGEIPKPPEESAFKPLLERTSAIIAFVFAIVTLAAVWGVDFSNDSLPLTRLVEVLIVVFGGYIAYHGVRVWVDSVISREEGDTDETHDSGGEPGGTGVSRLATLLPIFRNFLLVTIIVLTAMILLSEIGLDIAPLFAGAGVVGLAIGFGAQTLIRDIFSGAFFLMDDAFRRGEYIDIGTVKGTVEKISLRSFQLRHHNGPLHTVPFGEINQLTNYSRDWVIMKLPVRLTYDTDANKVRKMVKALGQELLDHPEIGDLFLEPLKSQGVMAMEDSAMIMRIKFTTKPGDQFIVRRFVLDEIRKLFDANGIKFANREVTVHLARSGTEMGYDKDQAVAGAGAAILDAPNQVPTKPKQDF